MKLDVLDGAASRSRSQARPPRRAEAGSAALAVVVLSLIVAAAGVGAITLARWQLAAAQRRVALAQLRWLGRAAVAAVGGWFEAPERGALVPPPAASQVIRDRRRVDPDGDGAGTLWSRATRPWNCRYKETRPERLFRPADGPEPEDQFLGAPDGPDIVVESRAGSHVLDELARALAPVTNFHVVQVIFFRPPPRAGPRALATVEVRLERVFPGGGATRVRARGEVLRIDWGRVDRPIEVARDAVFTGESCWRRGEAMIGGDLVADPVVWSRWPGGIPWLAPDQPLRDDADADGTPDDADGDGAVDLEAWRLAAGFVPDPWWRGRVGGRLVSSPPPSGPCQSPFPFGPRADPPAPLSKSGDRSGLFVLCPSSALGPPIDAVWLELAEAGVRGAWRADEDAVALGSFRLDGIGARRALADVLPRRGGVVALTPAPGRTTPLEVVLAGRAGAVLWRGGDGDARGGDPSPTVDAAPGDPRDTRGDERAGREGDDYAALREAGGCESWDVAPWQQDGEPSTAAARHPCGDADAHFTGLLAASGRLRLVGPVTVLGQVRAGALTADGAEGAARVLAVAVSAVEGRDRAGPPGAPRVRVADRRTVP